jgi:hypothetical protein
MRHRPLCLACDVNTDFLRATRRSREEVSGRTEMEIGFWAKPAERDGITSGVRPRLPGS